jgi:N-acetyl-anhydromuramoyl-L-alanine amidase
VVDLFYFETISDLQVSSHLLIDRQGGITQFVSFDDRAWHAGQSSYQGIENCNDYSIGIELEGTDDLPYSEDQYQTLAKVTRQLLANYPKLTPDRIAGHDQIAPGRKTDPGQAFDWVYFRSLIKESDS